MDDFAQFFIKMLVLVIALAAVVWMVRLGLFLLAQAWKILT